MLCENLESRNKQQSSLDLHFYKIVSDLKIAAVGIN